MRKPISARQNRWFNGAATDDADLTLEQGFNDTVQSGLINNLVGTGVLAEHLTPVSLFDSQLATGLLDGKAILAQNQPSDANLGNQLEVEVSNSLVAGKRAIKLVIIGLDFENNLQYDRFTFNKNEKQLTSKHYIRILSILFNDFIGSPTQSLNLSGRIVIREAKPVSLARDCIMVAQDVEPNVFFRDFFVSTGTLTSTLTTALPTFNIDTLNITTSFKQLRSLAENDVSSQIGQKFQAVTNNIQKITLLLAVTNSFNPTDLEWTGDLIVSIFQLQSALDCPLDIAPGTAIDFDPSNIPLAQLSLNFATLTARGIVLSETPQPVDFIFSNTPVGAGTVIKSGSYYAVTVKRAGSANTCAIEVATGTDRIDNSKSTFFNGAIWVDIPDEDLWFQVWTDAAKVVDGQAYDAGHGVAIPKTQLNNTTGITEDHIIGQLPFIRNDVYYGVLDANTELSGLTQDQRTGEEVFSQQQFVPQISLITATDLISREVAADPLVIGNIADKNAKSVSSGSANVDAKFHHFSMIGNQCILKVIDDPSDGYRYDLDVLNFITELTGGGGITDVNALLNGKFIPNTGNPNTYYRISDSEIISMIYGDLNGDGVVDNADLVELETLLNSDLNVIPSHADYVTLTTLFKDDTGLTWKLLANNMITVLESGADGILTPDPLDGTRAVFTSASAMFVDELAIATKFLQISGDISNPGNNGTFKITGLIDNLDIDIQKSYYTSDTILKILRADINGDMIVDTDDLTLLANYIDKVSPFPAVESPPNKIGTEFTAIRFTLEAYIDRADDYTASGTRSTAIHPLHDILIDGYTAGFPLFGTNLKFSPVALQVTKQLNWFDYLVNATSNPKLVPISFNYQSGFVQNVCSLQGVVDDRYPLPPTFDPGRNDLFIPNNLIINNGGEIMRPDGYFMKMDFEIGTVVLDMPAISFSEEKIINIFTDCVANFTGRGTTRLGFESMRFADCSFVSVDALLKGQVRFAVSVRSLAQQIVNGPSLDGYVDGLMDVSAGVAINPETGILTLRFENTYEDPVLQTLKTRVQVVVYLKKSGFNNQALTINSTQVKNLLGL